MKIDEDLTKPLIETRRREAYLQGAELESAAAGPVAPGVTQDIER